MILMGRAHLYLQKKAWNKNKILGMAQMVLSKENKEILRIISSQIIMKVGEEKSLLK